MTRHGRTAWAFCVLTLIACNGSSDGEAGPNTGGENGDLDGGNGGVDPNAVADDNKIACVNTSGTRLRVRKWVTAEGTEHFVGWHDKERDEECSYRIASDGKMRCVPSSSSPIDTLHLDAACTQPVVQLTTSPCDVRPKYATLAAVAACERPRMVAVGAVATFGVQAYRKQGNDCVAAAVPTTTYYELGAPVDPNAFVEGIGGVADGATRLRRRTLSGADGSRELCRTPALHPGSDTLYDSKREEECRPEVTPDGRLRCIPTRSARLGSRFRDANCATPSIDLTLPTCGSTAPLARYVSRNAEQVAVNLGYGCFWTLTQRLHALGPELDTV
jgi:hypothetical protein